MEKRQRKVIQTKSTIHICIERLLIRLRKWFLLMFTWKTIVIFENILAIPKRSLTCWKDAWEQEFLRCTKRSTTAVG